MELREKYKAMRKKTAAVTVLLLGILAACDNQPNDFPDFHTQAVYFPVQFPVRTLSLGNDRIDNSLDKELKFHIGVSIGGMYENTKDWEVSYVVDPALADSITTADGDTILPLPAEYYTIDPNGDYPSGEIIIPSGSFNGKVLIQLEDAFLDDPMAFGHHFVVPLRIPATENPDKRFIADWDANALPKDFTLFMVKFVNRLHGSWLHRGVDYKLDTLTSAIIDTIVYRERYVTDDQVWKLDVNGRHSVQTNGVSYLMNDFTALNITFNDAGTLLIDSIPGSVPAVLGGSGHYEELAGEWGGQARDMLFLEYMYNDGEFDHQVYDTLVFRDRGIAYEEFEPVKAGL